MSNSEIHKKDSFGIREIFCVKIINQGISFIDSFKDMICIDPRFLSGNKKTLKVMIHFAIFNGMINCAWSFL